MCVDGAQDLDGCDANGYVCIVCCDREESWAEALREVLEGYQIVVFCVEGEEGFDGFEADCCVL